LANEEHGYCLLYPADFDLQRPVETEVVLVSPVPEAGDRALAFVEVTDAAGQTTVEAAEAAVTERTGGLPGFDIFRGEITLDGEPAVLLDRLPGQDLTRQIVVVRAGRLFKLTFVPSNPNLVESYDHLQRVFAAVLDSFRFIP
jgi:hypothetical protein